jgi:predicted DNA-binding transcriptional regulator AlpA
MSAQPSKRLLGWKDLRAEKGVPWSRAQIDRAEAREEFPRRIRLGLSQNARVAWIESEIDAWIERWRAVRDGGAGNG